MRKSTIMMIAVAMLLGFASTDASAGEKHCPEYAGIAKMYSYFYNWMRDDDGDGIPNCIDPDYVKPEDGTGYGRHKGDGTCSDDCDKTPDRIRDRTRLHQIDCLKSRITR